MMKDQFHIVIRLLHWLMALAIFTMLFVGAGMVSSVANRDWLYDLHKPLGITILVLAILRLVVRLSSRNPPLPSDMPLFMQLVAKLSHVLLYGLMLALPMIATPGFECAKIKEVKASEDEFPDWGDLSKRYAVWELTTALGLLYAGADILIMYHPEAAVQTKKTIIDLMQ